MNIEELEKIADEKNSIYFEKTKALEQHIERVLMGNIPFELAPFIKLYGNTSSAQVEVKLPNEKRGHMFDLYYHPSFGKKPRRLEMNFGCFGSFKADDETEIIYCKVLGFFASHLAELEQKLIFSDEGKKAFAEYDQASSENYRANEDVKNAKWQQKKAEDEIKKDEILNELAIGTHIKIDVRRCNTVVKTIGNITTKNVMFKEDYGKRTKKDELLAKLVNGDWQIVK